MYETSRGRKRTHIAELADARAALPDDAADLTLVHEPPHVHEVARCASAAAAAAQLLRVDALLLLLCAHRTVHSTLSYSRMTTEADK